MKTNKQNQEQNKKQTINNQAKVETNNLPLCPDKSQAILASYLGKTR